MKCPYSLGVRQGGFQLGSGGKLNPGCTAITHIMQLQLQNIGYDANGIYVGCKKKEKTVNRIFVRKIPQNSPLGRPCTQQNNTKINFRTG
jgi:hypothetical protein